MNVTSGKKKKRLGGHGQIDRLAPLQDTTQFASAVGHGESHIEPTHW